MTFALDAYLQRIGLAAAPRADRQGLAALQAAHLAAIPFEDLDCALGRVPDLTPATVHDKLIVGRRGGWCFEHVVLFGAALDALGFAATRHLARMQPDRKAGIPPTHALLRVRLPDGDVLADVGLGAGPLEPLALEPHPVRPTKGGWPYGVEHRPDGAWRLLTLRDGAPHPIHGFSLAPADAAALAEGNRHAATHPASPFPGRVIAMHRQGGEQVRLTGRKWTTATPDGEQHQEVSTNEALRLLDKCFGVRLQGEDAARLRALLDAA